MGCGPPAPERGGAENRKRRACYEFTACHAGDARQRLRRNSPAESSSNRVVRIAWMLIARRRGRRIRCARKAPTDSGSHAKIGPTTMFRCSLGQPAARAAPPCAQRRSSPVGRSCSLVPRGPPARPRRHGRWSSGRHEGCPPKSRSRTRASAQRIHPATQRGSDRVTAPYQG